MIIIMIIIMNHNYAQMHDKVLCSPSCDAKKQRKVLATPIIPFLQSLKEVSLRSGCGDEDVGRLVREALLVNTSIHRLTLDLRECSDAVAAYLAELIEKTSSVKFMTLMLNNVTPLGAEIMAAALPNSTLLSLTLYATQMDLHDLCVGDDGAKHFANALTCCKNLTAFGIAQSGISDTGLACLLQALELNPRVASLNLHSNFIASEGASNISRFLSTSSHLKQLILNENHCIGDEGGRELALALCHNTTLEVLSLKSCGIGQRGAERFATPLSQNSSLRVLNLCGNITIGDDGVEMIARGLNNNSTLQKLDLSSCGVTDEGCDHLAGTLSTSSTGLTHLTLHKNAISDGGAVSLAHALSRNSSLVALVLSDNPVGEKGVAALGQAMEHNVTLTSLMLQSVGTEWGTKSPARGGTSKRADGDLYRLQATGEEKRSSITERLKLTETEAGGCPARKHSPQQEGAGKRKVLRQRLSGSTLALVEVLVSKNRHLTAYKKKVRELKQQIKILEETQREMQQQARDTPQHIVQDNPI